MKLITQKLMCFTISVVMSLLCVNASADVIDTGKTLKARPEFIPSQFTINNQSVLFLEEEGVDDYHNETDQTKFTLFNSSLEEVTSFTTPFVPTITATYITYYAVHGPINVQETNRQKYTLQEGVSEEDFIQFSQQQGYNRGIEKDGEVWMLPSNSWEYFEYDYFGDKYPEKVIAYKDGEIIQIAISYGSEYGFIGYNDTGNEIIDYAYAYPKDIDLISSGGCEDATFVLSQTLFNDDEAYEWIEPTYSIVEVSDSTEFEKIKGEKILTTGFKVVSQNGSTISDVALPAECWGDDVYFDLYITDSGTFLLVHSYTSGSEEDYYMVYKVEAASSSIKSIGAPRKVSVSPSAPRQGTPVNVNLGEAAGNTTKVSVVSVGGRTELVQTIKPGSTETVINTDRLERGVYVVVVDNGTSKREATKIVVR